MMRNNTRTLQESYKMLADNRPNLTIGYNPELHEYEEDRNKTGICESG